MKVILGIMCGLVVMFAGTCALLLVFSGMGGGGLAIALLPAGIAALNVLVLMALFGREQPQTWAFYLLGGLDVIAAILTGVFWSSISFQVTDIWTIAVPVVAALLVKAVLTFMMAQRLAGPPAE